MQPAVHIISTLAAKLARISGAHVVHPIAGQYCDDRLIPEEHQKQDKLLLYLTGCDTCVTRCGLWERQKCPEHVHGPRDYGPRDAARRRDKDFPSSASRRRA